jgi:hypothetical protein
MPAHQSGAGSEPARRRIRRPRARHSVPPYGPTKVGLYERASIGGGKEAYFETGSLALVVIPEPATSGLLLLRAVAGPGLLRRKLYG